MLKKQLGFFNVFSIAAGAMISSGLFVLPGIAFAKAGPSIIISYLLAGLLMIPSMLSNAELATAMPKSGGSYFFIERSMGPVMGTIAGFANWFSITLKSAFAMIGIGAIAAAVSGQNQIWVIKSVASICCVVFLLLNLISVKGVGRFQTVMVLALIAALAWYISKGFGSVEHTRYSPFMTAGWGGVFAVAGMVFVSFGGLTKVIDISEEVKNSGKNIPLGMFSAFVVVNIIYLLAVFVTVGVTEPGLLSGSLTPVSLAAGVIAGNTGRILIGTAAFFAFATTANAGLLSASRTPMAMSRDGLVPKFLSDTSRRFHTPHYSLFLTAVFMLVVIFTLSIENLVKTASTIMILMFILINVSVVIMRHSGIQGYRPRFKSPFTPWLQIGTVCVYIFLILEMGYFPLAMTAGFAIIAMLWYLVYVQRRIDRESAIVYLVKRIVSKHIQRSGIEDELKQIALERDEIAPDRFDKLIKNCPILDIKEKITAKELFARSAEVLAPRLGIDEKKIYELLIEREKESETVIAPGLAIPHIVVDGENVFEVLPVRCCDGVVFSELGEPVRTAFVLIGSSDERNYHLRALMSIAHIVSEADFERRWSAAANIEQLRDIVLLSGRKRG